MLARLMWADYYSLTQTVRAKQRWEGRDFASLFAVQTLESVVFGVKDVAGG
jgi:hypothetical protein